MVDMETDEEFKVDLCSIGEISEEQIAAADLAMERFKEATTDT
jgi:hypothetical protein